MSVGNPPALLNEDHRVLLRAAFAKPPESVRCWERWRHWMDTEAHLDSASFRLISCLYTNLAPRIADDPLMQRVKGVIRYTWVRNQKQLAQQIPLFRSLSAAGLEILVLPPVALWMAEPRLGADGNNLLPLAVRGDLQQLLSVSRILIGQGWLPTHPRLPGWAFDGFVLAGRYMEFRRHDGYRLRVFWTQDGFGGAPDAACWDHAVPAGPALAGVRLPRPIDNVRYLLRQPPGGEPLQAATDLLLALNACAGGLPADLFEGVPMDPGWARLVAELCSLLDSSGVTQISTHLNRTIHDPRVRMEVQTLGLWTRVRRQWGLYRDCLEALPGKRQALRHLPGYLVGKWGLASLRALIPRLGRALRRPGVSSRFPTDGSTGG